jgi:hypothetical protein
MRRRLDVGQGVKMLVEFRRGSWLDLPGDTPQINDMHMNIKLVNIKLVFCSFLACFLAVGCVTSEKQLAAQAKISKADAEKIALAKVPNGTIKEGELEKENGKLIWSFDIASPGTKDITEVQVDAVTGQVVSVAKETPAQQEKEKKEK